MPFLSNLPALRLTIAYALHDPASLLPHSTIPTFLHLPVPVSKGLPLTAKGTKPKIRALVIDKDNTLCPPETSELHPAYLDKLKQLQADPEFAHNKASILIVSNTAGSTTSAVHEAEARLLETKLGIPVLRQQPGRKKPLCGPDVLKFFKDHGVTDQPSEIVFVGDRLATDVLGAREVRGWSYWCRDGWRSPEAPERDYRGVFGKLEASYERILRTRFGKVAPLPTGEK